MKRILIALLALACLLTAPAFAQRTGKQSGTGGGKIVYTLTVKVNVPGAMIVVDGVVLSKGNTASLPAGNHTVLVKADGYGDYNATVNMTGDKTLNVNLAPEMVTLAVSVNVNPFAFWVDGRPVKGNAAQVTPGNHQVKVTAPGYAPYEASVQVNQSTTLTVNLQQDLADLTILVNVKGAQIWVDGAMLKGNVAKVNPGSHQVKVIAAGFVPYEMNVQVNQSMTLNVNLEQDVVDLTILVNVKGAQLWVDNEQLKGNVARVRPGSHQVQAQAPGYQVYLQTVVVNQSMTLNVNLQQSLFSLNVFCDVKGVQIFVNDAEQRGFPVKLPAGKYGIKARARGYADYYEEITLNGDYNLKIQMRQNLGSIVISIPSENKPGKGSPQGIRLGTVDVYVDNQPVKLGPAMRAEVAPGMHRVKVVYDGMAAEIDIQIDADMVYTVEPFLQLKVSAGR